MRRLMVLTAAAAICSLALAQGQTSPGSKSQKSSESHARSKERSSAPRSASPAGPRSAAPEPRPYSAPRQATPPPPAYRPPTSGGGYGRGSNPGYEGRSSGRSNSGNSSTGYVGSRSREDRYEPPQPRDERFDPRTYSRGENPDPRYYEPKSYGRQGPATPPKKSDDDNGKPKPSNPPRKGGDDDGGGRPKPTSPPRSGSNNDDNGPGSPPRYGGGDDGDGGGYTFGGGYPPGGIRQGSSGSSKPSAPITQESYFKRRNRTETGPVFAPHTGGANTRANNNQRNLITRPMNPMSPPKSSAFVGGDLGDRNSREEIQPIKFRVRRDDNHDGRSWYFHYDPYWRDCHFGYRYWVFDYWNYDACYSPYYFYYSLPPYLAYGRCHYSPFTTIIIIGGDLQWYYCGRGSGYYDDGYYSRNFSRLDRALSDLTDAFMYADSRALQRLLPTYGDVAITIDGDYAYSLNADDYYDMTADLLYSVCTTNFEILNVRRARTGEFWVSARHSYIDSWNRPQCVYMTFTLAYVDGRFVIVQAGTGLNRAYGPGTNY